MTGEPPSADAWRRFLAELADASARDDATSALTAVLDMLAAAGVPPAEPAVLTRLRLALSDVAGGREVPEMLRPAPKPKGGRPPPPSAEEVQRAFAVALADVYRAAGQRQRDADARAARKLAHLPALRGAGNGAKAVSRWREDAAADVARAGTLRVTLDALRARLASESDPRVVERAILRAASAYGAFRFGATKAGENSAT